MIDIKKLTNADIGKWVEYKTYHKTEDGKIKGWNNNWIFVVYLCNNEWDKFKDYTGNATEPNDLSFIDGNIV